MDRVCILFGSQTGSAADVAERLQRVAVRHHLPTVLQSLDDYPIASLVREKMAVFVVATTGQGDPPDNMLQFWKFILRRNLPQNSLANVKVAVLGLGDSSYLKFNFVAKKLAKRLEQLGASTVVPVGLADEQHDLGQEFVIEPWADCCVQEMLKLFTPLSREPPVPRDVILPSKFKLTTNDNRSTRIECSENGASYSQSNPFHAKMLSNERVTSDAHWQDVRLIRLDLSDSRMQYNAGDVMVVAPTNPSDDVQQFLELFKLDGSEQVCVTSRRDAALPHALQQGNTWRWLAEQYFDICGTPKS